MSSWPGVGGLCGRFSPSSPDPFSFSVPSSIEGALLPICPEVPGIETGDDEAEFVELLYEDVRCRVMEVRRGEGRMGTVDPEGTRR